MNLELNEEKMVEENKKSEGTVFLLNIYVSSEIFCSSICLAVQSLIIELPVYYRYGANINEEWLCHYIALSQ